MSTFSTSITTLLNNSSEKKWVGNLPPVNKDVREYALSWVEENYDQDFNNVDVLIKYYGSLGLEKSTIIHLIGIESEEKTHLDGVNDMLLLKEKDGLFSVLRESWHTKKTIEIFWQYVCVALIITNFNEEIKFHYSLCMMESYPHIQMENLKLNFILKRKINHKTKIRINNEVIDIWMTKRSLLNDI